MSDSKLVTDLRAKVRQERFRSKVLLVSDFEVGHSLVRQLALTGTPVINLRVCTPATLAAELAEEALAASGLTPASSVVSLLLVEDLLAGANEGTVLGAYLGRAPRTAGLAESFQRAITELRLAGLTADTLEPARFETPQKGLALLALLRGYEQALSARGLVDLAQLYQLALDQVAAKKGPSDRLFLIPGRIRFRAGLEQQFIDAVAAGRAHVLAHDQLDSLSLSADASVYLGHAAGVPNEVRAALRRMLDARSPFDAVELAVTEYEEYSRSIHDLCAGLGIPITFSQGIALGSTLPGRSLNAFLTWVEGGFMIAAIARALAEGVLVVPGAGPGQGPELAALLRKSPIGWGRERYLPVLQSLEDDLQRRLNEDDHLSEGRRRAQERRREHVALLRGWFSDLLTWLPEPRNDGTVALADLCKAGLRLLVRCLPETKGIDTLALNRLTEFLTDVERAGAVRYPLKVAALRLVGLVADLRVGESGPRPGHLHIADLEASGWAGRSTLFVVGLDQERFPGVGLQDPILLDTERGQISPDLPLSHQGLEQKRERLSFLLANHRGDLNCSYSTWDAASGRSGFPSAAMLELERIRTGDGSVDYSQLLQNLGAPISYAAPDGSGNLDVQDWWLTKLMRPDGLVANAAGAVKRAYPHLARGLDAAEARSGAILTPYDGCIGPAEVLDPRRNQAMVLSPSRIEELAACPLRYFYRYVLEIAPPEELAYDPGRWLDAAQRGQLLHKLFERFLRELKDEGVARPVPAHLDRLLALADAVVMDWRAFVPPPFEAVFEAERAEIRRSATIFLRAETEEPATGSPAFFELGFGSGAPSLPGEVGLPDPVLIPTASGSVIRLRGRIDRIDLMEGRQYSILDYKTGSSYGYQEQGYFKRGRQIQHALYAVAAEEALRQMGLDDGAQVVSAGYFFPTERGEGERVLRQQDRRNELGQLLDELSDLAGSGTFVAAEDTYGCTYCDYRAACGAERAAEQTKAKLETNAELAPLRRIATYE